MLPKKISNIINSSFFYDFIHSFLTKAIYIGSGFFATLIITRNLSVEEYGEYSYILAIVLTIFQFSHLGFSASNTFHLVKNKRILRFIFGNSNTLSAITGIASILFLVLFNEFYLNISWFIILFAALSIPFQTSALLNKGILIGIKKVKTYNNIELISRVIYLLLLIILLLTYTSVTLFLLVYTVQMISLALISGYSISKSYSQKQVLSLNLFKKNYSYAFRIYLTTFLAFLVLRIDIYFIENLLNNKEVGIYSLAVTLASNFILFIKVIAPLLVPKLLSIDNELNRVKKIFNILLYSTVILFFINISVMYFSEFIIINIFGEKYLDSIPVLIILLPAASFLSLESILVRYFASIGKLKFLSYYWIVTLLVNIVLNYFWIPQYGIVGAAWASLISYFLMFFFVFLKVVKIGIKLLHN